VSLQEENHRLLNTLIRHTKKTAERSISQSNDVSNY